MGRIYRIKEISFNWRFILNILSILFFSIPSYLLAENQNLVEANKNYNEGLKLIEVVKQRQAFEKALSLYRKVEISDQTASFKAALYQYIGDCFFQLERYPWALLYYYRADSQNPCQSNLENSINMTLNKLNLPKIDVYSGLHQNWHLDYAKAPGLIDRKSVNISNMNRLTIDQPRELSHSPNADFDAGQSITPKEKLLALCTITNHLEKNRVFLWSFLALFFAATLYIWIGGRWAFLSLILITAYNGILIITLLLSTYFNPIYGIMVNTSKLYSAPTKTSKEAATQLLFPGMKLKISAKTEDGKWLIVTSPENIIGFVPQESIRLI